MRDCRYRVVKLTNSAGISISGPRGTASYRVGDRIPDADIDNLATTGLAEVDIVLANE
jgi:hypothetical protein